jgi:Cu(I)/Ag(I) efflux system membrane fusion protein
VLSAKEGMYVERGKVLFNVVNSHKAVVMLKVKASDISKIHSGQKVNYFINNDSSMMMTGKVDFIEPVFSNGAKTLTVRVNMNNENHQHKIGSLVNATIIADSLETLWVPKSSIVDLGKSKIAWLQKENSFKAVKVETGVSTMGMVEITDGLTESSMIAEEAHYLTDSEGFVKINEDEK